MNRSTIKEKYNCKSHNNNRSNDRNTYRSNNRNTHRSNDRNNNGTNDQNNYKLREKNQLLDYIYSVDLSKYDYDMLKTEEDLPKLFEKEYHLTPNFCGVSSLLVFTKIRNRYFSFVVDRSTLKYTRDRVDPSKVKFKNVSVEADSTLYNGTIFDGIYIEKNQVDKFYISDVYTFKGSDWSSTDLEIKIEQIRSYFEFMSPPALDVLKNRHKYYQELELSINSIYPIGKVERFITKTVPKFKDCKVRGICFYPKKSGTRLVYLFNNSTGVNTTNRTNRNNTNNRINSDRSSSKNSQFQSQSQSQLKLHKFTKTRFVSNSKKTVYANLEMKKTGKSDVYYLYSVQKKIKNGKSVLIKVKMGIAHIPTTERSNWCKKAIMNSSKGRIMAKCMFHNNFGKWEPIEQCKDVKIPDYYKDIEIEEIEETDSEDEEN